MKARKAIKAIAALGAGISMVGATILGAMAANLADYPAPFVKTGVFDGLVVVGDKAAAEDVVGAIDIGTSLQYAMRQQATSGTGLPAVSISEGKKIEKTGDKMNYGDEMADVISALDNEDLPVILADGRYQDSEGETSNDEKYTQMLRFTNTTLTDDGQGKGVGEVVFAQNDDGDKAAADYLLFDDGTTDYAYNYTLEFDNDVEYTYTAADTPAEDLEDTTIKIQGNDYTITDVKYDATFNVTRLTLLAGETIIWLQQGKTLTRTISGVEHEVEVVDVNDAEDMCGVAVDGDTVWIKKGQTQTINGVQIGVTDAVAVHAQLQDVDICKINVGATEIVLDDGKEVEVNAKTVDGSLAQIVKGTSGGTLSQINIAWAPDDEEYIAKDGSLVDPVLSNFEFKFAGISKKTEDLSLTASSDEAEFVFVNNDGKEVSIPYFWNGSAITMGDDYTATDCDGRLLLEGDNCNNMVDIGSIEGVMFLVVTSGKEAHVMQITSLKNTTTDQKVDIKDITYGKTYDDKYFNMSDMVTTLTLGSLGTIQLLIEGNGSRYNFSAVDVNLQANGIIETKYGANITIDNTWTAVVGNATYITQAELSEENDEQNALKWNTTLYYYATDDELRVGEPKLLPQYAQTAQWNKTTLSASKTDKDTKYYVSEWGTMGTYDSDNKDELDIAYPDEQVYGNVFVAPVGATVSGAGGEWETVTLNPINVGSAKLASEVIGQEKSQNVIVVGGPCVNEAAAVVMGLTFPACGADSTIPENKAIVKLYENGGYVAMVIAGWTAADTRRATTVVAKYADYADKLTGSEVVVSGTTMSDIDVKAPSS